MGCSFLEGERTDGEVKEQQLLPRWLSRSAAEHRSNPRFLKYGRPASWDPTEHGRSGMDRCEPGTRPATEADFPRARARFGVLLCASPPGRSGAAIYSDQ